MSGKIEQGLHEKLCAYVLGEIESEDRVEVERELLRSPELRAERARLEATIGVVREAMQPAQTLSPAMKDALERAVRPSKVAQFPWMRLAAGIGAVGLGWWIFAGAPQPTEGTIARLDDRSGAASSRKSGEVDRLEEVERARTQTDRLTDAEQAKADAVVQHLGYAGGTAANPVAPAAAGARPELQDEGSIEEGVLGWDNRSVSSEDASLVAIEEDTVLRGFEVPLQSVPADPNAIAAERRANDEKAQSEWGSTSIGMGAAGVRPSPFGARQTGSGARGRVAKLSAAGSSGGTSKSTELPPPSASGTYRGPGDAVPPGMGGTGGAQATSAPAPSTPGLAKASSGDDFFTGLGQTNGYVDPQKTATGVEVKELESLGYASGKDEDAVRQRQRTWNELTPEEQQRAIELRYTTIARDCFPRPNERPRDMFFRFWGDNPFEVTLLDKQSTFSADVDTASYALARRYLNEGRVPEKAQIRTEEFVNYFASDVEAPRNAMFSVHSDLTPSRFSADSARRMLRVVVRAKDVDKSERQPMRLTFVVDVSGSMKEQNRLETVKHSLRMLVAQLDGRDSIALVKFSTDAQLVLPMTPVLDRAAIEAAIAPLVPDGSTNSNAGLQLGYAQALQGLDPQSTNRVVFLSDGVANVGETDAAKILEGVRSIREKGIYLNTIGVGMNNHNDVLLEQLADKGDGLCNYVDSPKEIQRALVDRFTGAFQPVAKDVKIQVEFDPAQVMRYRLLGYENRAIADADFRNDAVDAGELNAGHQVTALYEIEPTGAVVDGPMATVRLRWKPIRAAGSTGTEEATEAAFQVSAKSYQAFESAPIGHRRALIVAQFAEILRRSIHARGESLADLLTEATKLQAQIPNDKDFAELVTLVSRARAFVPLTDPACDEMCRTIDALRTNRYYGAVIQETGSDAQTLQEVEESRIKLEQRLRELLRQQASGDLPKLESLGYTNGPR